MMLDNLLHAADTALRTLFAPAHASRPCPAKSITPEEASPPLDVQAQHHAAALMRVNHVGEICAQALYTAQAMVSRDPQLRQHLLHAADEEQDHLAWTANRIQELGSHTSRLNPLWYAGAFAIGAFAGRIGGDKVSLGFVVETENQVSAHLQSHLEQLPVQDLASRAIVTQMHSDEQNHAEAALKLGAIPLPPPIQGLMRAAAKIMTTVAYRV